MKAPKVIYVYMDPGATGDMYSASTKKDLIKKLALKSEQVVKYVLSSTKQRDDADAVAEDE